MKIYLSSKGVSPDIDNSKIINRAIEAAKEGSTLIWTDGIFPIASTIVQNKKLNWEGSEETILKATSPITLAKFTGGYKANVSNIQFQGSCSIYDKVKEMIPGVQVSSVIRMRDVTIRNVWGSGIVVSSDIEKGSGNASAGRFENLDIVECAEHGMYFQGGDANQCGIYHADIRDCNGVGIYDNSFLGNQFFSCMTHNNKQGSYRAEDANNRAGFFGCYAEQGQGPVYLAGAACWFGGLPSDGVIIDGPWAKVFSYSTVEIKHL